MALKAWYKDKNYRWDYAFGITTEKCNIDVLNYDLNVSSGNATTTLNLTITPHTYDFNIDVYSFTTYYDCKRCNYSYSKKTNTILPARTTRSASAVSKDRSSAKNAVKKAKIKNLKVKSKAKKKITVSWKKIKKVDGY